MSFDRPSKISIDVNRHLDSRRAMKDLRERWRGVFITSERFDADGRTARVLVDGEYYDVGETDLRRLQAGRSPKDLELYPIAEDSQS